MASISISGGGSIPSRTKSFTSDGTPEAHAKLFADVDAFVAEWKSDTAAQDQATNS